MIPPATKNAKNKSIQANKKDQKTTKKKASFSLDFLEPKKGQDNTQKEKNVHFLSGGVLRRQLNKGAVGFLKKNLKMRPLFLAIFWNFVIKLSI